MNTKILSLPNEAEFQDIPILSEDEIFRETILRKYEELAQMVPVSRHVDISTLFPDRPLRKETIDKLANIDEPHLVLSIDKIISK